MDEEDRRGMWENLQKKNVLHLNKELDTEHVAMVKQLIGLYPTFFTMLCDKANIGKCFNDEVQHLLGEYDPVLQFLSGFDNRQLRRMKSSWDPVHTSMYLWSKSALSNFLLVFLGDRCEMGHSVEGRLPFLDHGMTTSLYCINCLIYDF